MNDKVKFAVFFVVPALLVLFVIQFILLAAFQLLRFQPELSTVRWPLFGLLFAAVGAGIGWALRVAAQSLKFDITDRPGSWFVGAWGLVWLVVWLCMYVALGPSDPALWDMGVVAKPEAGFAFIASGFGLWWQPRQRRTSH